MKHLLGLTLLGAASLLLSGEKAAAQPPIEEISIVAPHEITRKTVGRGSLGMPIEEVTLTHRVGFKDLDLKTEAGAKALEKRIKEVVKHACYELDELYPKSRSENRRCESKARESAQPQMEAAIAAARK